MKRVVLFVVLCLFLCFAQNGIITRAGYTTYDWQFGGPTYTWCRTDPMVNGVHVYWMWSNFNPGVDRNQRYNFYDYNTHTFLWTDGINVFTQRSGYGNIDLDPQVGDVVFSTHQGSSGALRPVVNRKDSSMSVGPLNFQWPPIAVSYNRAVHCAMMSCIDLDSLWYARIEPWPSWVTPIRICPPAPSPMYPSHNIAASKISNKVVVLWETYEGQGQERAFSDCQITVG